MGDGSGRGECFAGIGQQLLVFEVGVNGVHPTGFTWRWGGAGWAEVMVEGAFGGVVELF
ncbi:hypothetical protein D3C74_445500 [compost metagenome]